MRHLLSAAGGLLLLLVAGCGQEYTLDPLTLTQEALEISGALGADTVFPLDLPPEARVATRAELADALYTEVLQAVNRLGMEGSRAESLAREQSQGLSRYLGVKFFRERDAILVVPATVVETAAGLDPSEDVTRDLLRGLLLLEYAQALGARRYGADQLSEADADLDRSMARRAVVEGFARFLARRVASADRNAPLSLEQSLALCSRMIVGQPPETISSTEDAIADQTYRQLAFIHEQGEEFVTRVFEAGGEPAIRRLFEDPPGDPDLIAQPDWYLDPASRPVPTHDLERALTLFEERFEASLWNRQRLAESRPRIETQLAFAGQEDLKRMVRGIVAARTAMITARSEPEKNNVSLQVKEHTSAAEASFFFRQVRRIVESDSSGSVREIADPAGVWKGILFSRSAEVTGGVKILGCVVEAGVLTIAISFAGEQALEPSLMEILRVVVSGT